VRVERRIHRTGGHHAQGGMNSLPPDRRRGRDPSKLP
jgi:hypothetical protein